MAALRSEPALVAGNAVVVVLVRDERLGADGLLTAVTDEAVLVPRGLAVFQHPGSWRKGDKGTKSQGEGFRK